MERRMILALVYVILGSTYGGEHKLQVFGGGELRDTPTSWRPVIADPPARAIKEKPNDQ
jgi:hypothetical protein